MATLTYNGEAYTVDHAVKGADYIHGYDASGVLIVAFDGVTDFSCFSYDGDYMNPYTCLTEHCNTVVFCNDTLRTLGGRTVSPAMLFNIEFPTMDRWDGKTVYRKLIKYTYDGTLGNPSGYTDVDIPHGIANFGSLVGCRVIANGDTQLPFVSQTGGVTAFKTCKGENVSLRIVNDTWSSPTFYFDLSYIKDSAIPDDTSRLVITDDGNGDVTIQTQGTASIVDDGSGNVTIANSGSTSITDDGAGNVTIF